MTASVTGTGSGAPAALQVAWRWSARARRLSLRVSRLDGKITLTVPQGVPERIAQAFVDERQDWLRRALDGLPARCAVHAGAVLPCEGRDLTITPAAIRHAQVEGTRLLVPQSRAAGPAARVFLQWLARDRLAQRVDHHAGRLGRAAGRLTLRDTRSRWGSCNAAGDLMFSWRLVMAPPAVLDYVAAHEVAHLAHMDHSPAFWAAVARLLPDYATPRRWLREHGGGLHRYDFAA